MRTIPGLVCRSRRFEIGREQNTRGPGQREYRIETARKTATSIMRIFREQVRTKTIHRLHMLEFIEVRS